MRIHNISERTETGGLNYQLITTEYSNVHVIVYDQNNLQLKLILSKSSEALHPHTNDNHKGEGGVFSDIVLSQPDIIFAVNGTYNHYRKNYYPWHHNEYLVGDPVGLVKIREHVYNDNPHLTYNGYLQRGANKTWEISDTPNMESKYILSSRPLLIHRSHSVELPLDEMKPPLANTITAPSFINHGLQHHARTAVGIKKNKIFFIIAESEETEHSKGITLPELQTLGEHLHLESLLNLDGGGSSRFYLARSNNAPLQNKTSVEDEHRIIGNTLMIFNTLVR